MNLLINFTCLALKIQTNPHLLLSIPPFVFLLTSQRSNKFYSNFDQQAVLLMFIQYARINDSSPSFPFDYPKMSMPYDNFCGYLITKTKVISMNPKIQLYFCKKFLLCAWNATIDMHVPCWRSKYWKLCVFLYYFNSIT